VLRKRTRRSGSCLYFNWAGNHRGSNERGKEETSTGSLVVVIRLCLCANAGRTFAA
jgi:hypothetical protein